MNIEYETKILNINVSDVKKTLKKLGARKIFDRNMRRYVYETHPGDPTRWVRLRDDGGKVTLTFKRIEDEHKIEGTREIEVEVSDFEKTDVLLQALGLKAKAYQENRRIHYEYKGVCIEIDFWPKIPPYLEVEGGSKKIVENMVKKLGFKIAQTTSINTDSVYRKYGLDIYKFKVLKFDN